MKFRYISHVTLTAAIVFAAPLARAQVLLFSRASYNVVASSQAGIVSDAKSQSGTSILTSGTIGLSSYSSFQDAQGLSYASSVGGAGWSVATAGAVTTLNGHGGGIAEAEYNGQDTAATGTGTIDLYFDITTPAIAEANFDGTYGSDLYLLDSGTWTFFYGGLNGLETISLPAGSYKLSTGAGVSVSGSNYYNAGTDATLKVQAVPEPATLAAVSLSLLSLVRRRRR